MPIPLRSNVSSVSLLALLLFFMAPLAVPAQEDQVQDITDLSLEALLNQQVTVASKKAQKVEEAPAIISVITKQEMVDRGWKNLYDALTSLPGIYAVETYFGTRQIFFRGITSSLYNDKSLLLINGHPFWESIRGSYYIEAFPLDAVKRIEVIRGPGSTLYGTNAFAGVINVVTEQGGDMKGKASGFLRYGTYKTFEAGLSAGNQQGDLSWLLNVSWRNTDGFSVDNPADELGQPFSYRSVLNTKAFYGEMAWKGLRISTYTFQEEKSKIDVIPVALGSLDNTRNRFWGTFWMADYSHKFGNFDLRLRSSWNTFNMDFDSLLKGITPTGLLSDFTTAHSEGPRFDIEASTTYTPEEGFWDLSLGVGYERVGAPESPVMLDRRSQTILTYLSPFPEGFHDESVFAYLQSNVSIGTSVSLVAGLRGVHNADFGSFLNPRGGLVFRASENLFLKVLYGTAFRAPTMNEKYLTFLTSLGNRDLDPERLTTLEAGMDLRLGKHSMRLNAYHTRIRDLIGRIPGPQPGSTIYSNLNGVSTYQGVEAEIRGGLGRHLLYNLNAYLGRGEDTAGEEIPYIPNFIQNLGLTWKDRWFSCSLNTSYMNQVESDLSPLTPLVTLPEQATIRSAFLVHAKVGVSLSNGLKISLLGQNLTNRQVRAPEFVRGHIAWLQNGPGRTLMLEIRKDI